MKLMVFFFRRAAVQAILPAFIGFVKRLLHDVPESPEEARGGKARDDHHDEFVGKRAGHALFLSRSPAAPVKLLPRLPKTPLSSTQDVNAEHLLLHRKVVLTPDALADLANRINKK